MPSCLPPLGLSRVASQVYLPGRSLRILTYPREVSVGNPQCSHFLVCSVPGTEWRSLSGFCFLPSGEA